MMWAEQFPGWIWNFSNLKSGTGQFEDDDDVRGRDHFEMNLGISVSSSETASPCYSSPPPARPIVTTLFSLVD